MRKIAIVCTLLSCLISPLWAKPIPESGSVDGPEAITQNGYWLYTAFTDQPITNLDETLILWWTEKRRFKDGRFQLLAFDEGLSHYFGGVEKNWDAAKARVATQRQADPNSVAAVLAESIFWYQYAWDARGSGYARTVTAEGWKLFKERLARARSVLDQSKGRAAANPLWYYGMLQIATDEGWRDEEFDAVYEEALKRYPDFFIFYFAKARHLLPKWGGNMDSYDDFVNRTVQATRATDGESMYARLYWSYDGGQVEGNLFAESRATWPRMKKGFEDLMARYPDSYWNLNSFASFACKARDRETFVTLIGKIGVNVQPLAWRSNYSLDTCKTVLLQREGA